MKDTLLHPGGAFAASVILLLAFSVPARPQAITASLTGVIEDSSKAVIPGVTVTITNPQTRVSHQAETDNRGRYLIPELAPGTYDIVAGVAGFKSASRKGVAVNVGAKMEINFVLEIGDLSETVMITGGAPLVDTRQGSLSGMVEEKKILDLPLNGRNPYDLIALQPGIDSGDGGAGRGPSSNGMRGASSNYMLDGADNNNQTTATSVNTKVPLDAVQEFRVITNSYASEYGRNGGFVANVVTKSGTNAVHGSFWDFLRNDKLDANSFNSNLSGLPRDPYKRNQFGGTIGGPLVKDKVFYFGSVESTLARSAFSGAFRYPTPEYIASIPGPVARQLLTKYKPPVPTRNFVDSFSGFTLGPNLRGVPGRDGINESGIADVPLPTRFNGNQVMFKADANLNGGKDMISGRYSFDDGDQTSPLATGYEGFGNDSTYVSRGQNAVLNHIRVFSNNLVNEFRTGYNRYNSAYLRPDPTIPSLIFVSPATGFATPGAIAGFPQDFTENTFQWLDNLIWTRGSHSMKMGFEYRRTRNGSVFANFRDGEFRFRDSIAFGNDVPDRFSISVDPRTTPLTYPDYYRGYRGNEYYLFFQDDWKVNRKLTLNLGARYEYFGVPHNFRQELDSNFYFGPGATMAERIATADFRLTSDNPGDLKNLVWRKDYNNWAPRFGFAYDLMGDGKTSIRGGYGVFYERLFNNVFENIRFNLPVYANTQFFNLPGAAAEFTYGYPALSVLPQQLLRVPPVSPRHMDEDLRTSYSHNWFVGVERQILTHTVVELNYVGTAAFKLSATNNINRFQENGLRFNTRIANDNYRANLANSHYNSLQLGVRQRYNKGISYQGSYTWAHAIDQLSDTLPITNSNPDLGFREAFNPRGNYGSADFDRRHRFILNASWELPWLRAQQGLLRQAFGGWTLNGIYTVQSGYPFTISDFNDPNGDGNFQDRAQLVSGQNLSNALNTGKRPPVEGGVQLIKPGFFAPVPAGATLGNLGRNYLHGAGDQNYDFSVFKTFKTPWWNGETGNIQLRFEFFNLFNHPKLDLPDNDVDSGTFGQAFYGADTTGNLTGSNAFRIIQVALKFSF